MVIWLKILMDCNLLWGSSGPYIWNICTLHTTLHLHPQVLATVVHIILCKTYCHVCIFHWVFCLFTLVCMCSCVSSTRLTYVLCSEKGVIVRYCSLTVIFVSQCAFITHCLLSWLYGEMFSACENFSSWKLKSCLMQLFSPSLPQPM